MWNMHKVIIEFFGGISDRTSGWINVLFYFPPNLVNLQVSFDVEQMAIHMTIFIEP